VEFEIFGGRFISSIADGFGLDLGFALLLRHGEVLARLYLALVTGGEQADATTERRVCLRIGRRHSIILGGLPVVESGSG
jgi:hypothetical protein